MSRAAGLHPALQNADPALCLHTDARSLPRKEAVAGVLALAADLAAAQQLGRPSLEVNCSDSTLWGHSPAAVAALADFVGGQPPLLLIPLLAGDGRFTIDDVHCVRECSTLVPPTHTALAPNPIFRFKHSRPGEWAGERIAGRVAACNGARLPAGVAWREVTTTAAG